MSRNLTLAAVSAACLSLAAAAMAQTSVPANISAAVADASRPAADSQRDADRKPAEMLVFAGVRPGQTVVDFWPGGGYFTRIFAKAVGPNGTVYAVYPPPRPSTDPARPTPTPAVVTLAASPGYANVKPVLAPGGAIAIPTKADLVWTSQNYHDVKNLPGIDMMAVNKSIFDALKPGGTYVVLDHAANAGASVTSTLHRIDPAVVRREVEAAGFRFEGESNVLRNASDDHSKNVFDPSLRGHTDQFILKFRKPG